MHFLLQTYQSSSHASQNSTRLEHTVFSKTGSNPCPPPIEACTHFSTTQVLSINFNAVSSTCYNWYELRLFQL